MKGKIKLLIAALIALTLVTVAYAQVPYMVGSGNTGAGGDYIGSNTSVSIAASGTYTVPMGTWYILPDANGRIQFNTASKATTANWVNMNATGAGMFLFTDGFVVQILNTSSSVTSTNNIIHMH